MRQLLFLTIVGVVVIAGCAAGGGTPTPTPTPTPPDSDGDGLSDQRERELGTDPNKADTDGDGLDDEVELELGTDPLDTDTDGDGLSDQEEQVRETDPTRADTEGDGVTDSNDVCPTVDAEVTITVTFVSATDDADGFLDAADPYAKFRAGSEETESDFFEDPGEVTEPFSLTLDIPDDKENVELEVSLWDEDSHWDPGDTDDQLDVNDAGPDVLAWKDTYSISSSNRMEVQTEGGGDSNEDLDGNMEFQIESNC